jgi:hypothetical protein
VDARLVAEFTVGMTTKKHPELRRSTRVAADVPVALDVLMELQAENSEYAGKTITVNLHGALVTTPAPLKLGDHVKVRVHLTGKSAQAAVVFANHDLSQFGLELQTPENIWGVALPPQDWNMRRSDTGRHRDGL